MLYTQCLAYSWFKNVFIEWLKSIIGSIYGNSDIYPRTLETVK